MALVTHTPFRCEHEDGDPKGQGADTEDEDSEGVDARRTRQRQ